MSTNFRKVKDFHKIFDCARSDVPVIPPNETALLRFRLLMEEYKELLDEFGIKIENPELRIANKEKFDARDFDINNIAKELADILYVTYGFGVTFGLPMDDVFEEVHASNLSKLDKNGLPIRREDGKILKGENYFEANIVNILKKDIL